MADNKYTGITALSMVGAVSGVAMVELIGHINETTVVMTAENARELAFNILAAAEAADGDEFLFKFAQEEIKCDIQAAGNLLIAFREFRARKESPPSSRNVDESDDTKPRK